MNQLPPPADLAGVVVDGSTLPSDFQISARRDCTGSSTNKQMGWVCGCLVARYRRDKDENENEPILSFLTALVSTKGALIRWANALPSEVGTALHRTHTARQDSRYKIRIQTPSARKEGCRLKQGQQEERHGTYRFPSKSLLFPTITQGAHSAPVCSNILS